MAQKYYYLPTKYSNERLDYKVDWGEKLDPGDTIATVNTVQVIDGDIVLDSYGNGPTFVSLWLKDGTPGVDSIIMVVATTLQGRKMEIQAKIAIWADPA